MPPEEHSPSLREALAASFDAQEAASSPAPAETAAPPEDAPASEGPARDASGRFAPTTAEGPPAATETGTTPVAEPEMPDGYDPAIWSVLTPEARAQTAGWAGKQRETLAEREARLKGYEPIDRVLASRKDVLTAQFGGVDRALEQLFHLSDFAGRDPAGFVRYIAQQRGLDLAQLVGQPQQQQVQPQQADPRQFVAQLVQEQLAAADVDRSYQEFMAAPDLEHRSDPRVKRVMAALLHSGEAADYRQAYAMATQAHPDIGPKLRAAEAAAAAQAETARRAQAASAKASAAVSTVGAPGTARPPSGGSAPASVRAALESAWDQAGSRV